MTESTATPDLTPVLPPGRPLRERSGAFAGIAGGVTAIGVKELRGRMRGRRAFVILTIYLLLLGGFALMVERVMEANYATGFGGTSAFASSAIGQGIFAGLLFLMTLQVVFLAPSSTSGAISLEREKQTLELLITTPISSLAIIVGKLLSALVYVFLLIAASVPLMAVVLVLGGLAIAPTMIGAMTMTEQGVPSSRLTEGLAILHTGLVAGVAPGASIAGFVVDQRGASAAYGVALVGGILGALVAQTARRSPGVRT